MSADPAFAPSLRRGSARYKVSAGPIRGLLPLIALLIVWQLAGSETSVSFPRPDAWITAIGDLSEAGVLWPATRATLLTFVVSLIIATAIGMLLGMLIGTSRVVDRALTPIMDFFRSLPPPAIVPPAILLLGASLKMSVTVVVIAIVWPILLNTVAAMRAVPRVRLDMSRTLGLSAKERLIKVIVPSLLPGVMVGVRIAVSISLVVTLVVDILGSGEGLGQLITVRQQAFDAASVWGLLLLIGAFGFAVNALIAALERRLLRNWPGGV
jgi:ABC-type nitrate/sulfonate/bicarbonate transport system permease component